MTVHDALGRGQTDAYSGEFILPVQALERLKKFFGVEHIETGAVIRDTVKKFASFHFGIYTNHRHCRARGIFPGIVEQIPYDYFNHA